MVVDEETGIVTLVRRTKGERLAYLQGHVSALRLSAKCLQDCDSADIAFERIEKHISLTEMLIGGHAFHENADD